MSAPPTSPRLDGTTAPASSPPDAAGAGLPTRVAGFLALSVGLGAAAVLAGGPLASRLASALGLAPQVAQVALAGAWVAMASYAHQATLERGLRPARAQLAEAAAVRQEADRRKAKLSGWLSESLRDIPAEHMRRRADRTSDRALLHLVLAVLTAPGIPLAWWWRLGTSLGDPGPDPSGP